MLSALPVDDALMHRAALAVSSIPGDDPFPALVTSLADLLRMDLAFIALRKPGNDGELRMLAFCLDGRMQENFDYPIGGTPCETVVGREFRSYESGLCDRFPLDTSFAALGLSSYAGYPLNDSRGHALGLVSVVSRSPISDPETVESIVKIFAVRASAELERARQEEKLRVSEEQYRTIFNAAVDGLLVKDEHHRIVDVNAAYLAMHGYRREELVGHSLAAFIPPELLARCYVLMPKIIEGEPCHFEAFTQRRDGTRFPVEIHGVPMQHGGRPHALVAMRDISERKAAEEARTRLEEQLRQAQKMEAIGHLAGGIAHDFNNILTGILGYVVLAAERQVRHDDAKLAGYLEQAQASCRRARDLVQQLLTFSRSRHRERARLSLTSVVSEARGLVRSAMPATLEIDANLGCVPDIVADRVQVEQVLLNLCINARDALRGVGRIAVSVREASPENAVCTSCRAAFGGRFVELCVHDDGPGIADDLMQRIFEPFFSTKEVGKGSGMGLAVVHGIVHEHGGHVVVKSGPGQGATFGIYFPLCADTGEQPALDDTHAATVNEIAPAPAGRVLVVDDEATIGAFMRDLLESWGVAATVVQGPEAALEALAAPSAKYDLLITDQTMPRMSGIELAKRVAERDPRLPIVLFSGYAEGIDPAALESSPIRQVVRKPVEPADLRRVVTRFLG